VTSARAGSWRELVVAIGVRAALFAVPAALLALRDGRLVDVASLAALAGAVAAVTGVIERLWPSPGRRDADVVAALVCAPAGAVAAAAAVAQVVYTDAVLRGRVGPLDVSAVATVPLGSLLAFGALVGGALGALGYVRRQGRDGWEVGAWAMLALVVVAPPCALLAIFAPPASWVLVAPIVLVLVNVTVWGGAALDVLAREIVAGLRLEGGDDRDDDPS
jgi:hypothetical protein